jgi:hypothetical protein
MLRRRRWDRHDHRRRAGRGLGAVAEAQGGRRRVQEAPVALHLAQLGRVRLQRIEGDLRFDRAYLRSDDRAAVFERRVAAEAGAEDGAVEIRGLQEEAVAAVRQQYGFHLGRIIRRRQQHRRVVEGAFGTIGVDPHVHRHGADRKMPRAVRQRGLARIAPVKRDRAGHDEAERPGLRIVVQVDVADELAGDAAAERVAHLAQERLAPVARKHRAHARGEVAPHDLLVAQRHISVCAVGGVNLEPGLGQGDARRAERDLLERGAAGAQRQSPAQGRDGEVLNRPVAGPGAVEPVGFVADPRPHDDMVEGAEHRQPVVHQVAGFCVHRHRLGVDAEPLEQRDQHRRLALAVGIAARPALVRRGRQVIARPEEQGEIAHLVLHQPQGGHRAHPRVRAERGDPGDLGAQRRAGGKRRGALIIRGELGADLRPVAELAELEHGSHGEPWRHHGRRRRRHRVGQVDRQARAARRLADVRVGEGADSAPLDRQARRPGLADAELAHRLRARGQDHVLGAQRQHVGAAAERPGGVEHVPDLQPLGLHDRGQIAVEHRRFEIVAALEHGEALAVGEQVDHLAAAPDADVMDDQVGLGRVPDDGQIADRLQRFRGLGEDCEALVMVGAVGGIIALRRGEQDLRAALGPPRIGRRQLDILDPGRRRRIARLARGGRGIGRRRRRVRGRGSAWPRMRRGLARALRKRRHGQTARCQRGGQPDSHRHSPLGIDRYCALFVANFKQLMLQRQSARSTGRRISNA